jgi:hypothetical protein
VILEDFFVHDIFSKLDQSVVALVFTAKSNTYAVYLRNLCPLLTPDPDRKLACPKGLLPGE